MKSFLEYQDTKKRVRPRFSLGELVMLTSEHYQYLLIVHKKKEGLSFYYSGDVLEADESGKLVVVRRTYDISEDQISRVPGVRHKK